MRYFVKIPLVVKKTGVSTPKTTGTQVSTTGLKTVSETASVSWVRYEDKARTTVQTIIKKVPTTWYFYRDILNMKYSATAMNSGLTAQMTVITPTFTPARAENHMVKKAMF